MLEFGFAKEQESKQKRRKPWIRYKREHSLSGQFIPITLRKRESTYAPEHTCLRLPFAKRVEDRRDSGRLARKQSKWKAVVYHPDDASRKVLASGEFDNATEENSLKVMTEATEKNIPLYPIRSVISDHGSQFYANKRDKNGNADHPFEIFLKEKGIEQILCGVIILRPWKTREVPRFL
jgi:transposase InsO family protein